MRIKEKAKERLLLQESICSFLKIRKVPIIIFTGIVVIFGILFYLYDIPFDAIIYGCELSFVWCAVCLFIDFYKYYKRHKLLHINREQFLDDAEQLPKHMDIIEYDYQELAKELYQAKQELISKNRIAKKELLDYYGMWVHQIKTPIAALDILLQNTEQMLYQLDEKEMMQETISVSDMKMELFKIEQYEEMALNYLRVEDISSDLVFKKHELDDMVRQVIRKYAKIFISKKIKMDFILDVAHGGEKSPATEKFQALCALSFIDVSVKHLSASSDSLIIILPNARFVNRFFITLYTCTIMSCLKATQMSFFNKLYRDIILKHQK